MRITEVHVAAEPEPQIQRCARCAYILIDVRNSAVMVSEGQPSVGCWGTGEFVGVIHGDPTQSFIMNHDATGPDEIACNRRVQ